MEFIEISIVFLNQAVRSHAGALTIDFSLLYRADKARGATFELMSLLKAALSPQKTVHR